MNFEPQKFFIGMVDFFSILMPGALLAYLGVLLSQGCFRLVGAETWMVFFFASYLLGHFVFLLGAKLDDLIYEPLRKSTYWGQVERLADGKGLSANSWRALAESSWLFGKNADAAVMQAQRLKALALQRPLSRRHDERVPVVQSSLVQRPPGRVGYGSALRGRLEILPQLLRGTVYPRTDVVFSRTDLAISTPTRSFLCLRRPFLCLRRPSPACSLALRGPALQINATSLLVSHHARGHERLAHLSCLARSQDGRADARRRPGLSQALRCASRHVGRKLMYVAKVRAGFWRGVPSRPSAIR